MGEAPAQPGAPADYDMIVIGGGVTGCGIARDAALRGLRVALAEGNDFASGTSSRSSRLIHGGVRYLEHGYLHLVFEASRERRRLLQLAPHLVRPLRFTWPVYRGARVPLWKLAAGLTLYDALALFRNVGRHRRLSAAGVLREEPRVNPEGLVGGALYFDAATDDARLTLAVALDAKARGADMHNHTRVTRLIIEGGRATGVEARDDLTGATLTWRAPMIVNAGGPWSDDIRALEGSVGAAKVQGSKGVHIAVPHDRVGNHEALTLLSPTDGRVMFTLPSGTQTIIGTTDTYTSASPDRIRASEGDIAYLLDAANAFFPEAKLTRTDVISSWAGIRPLAASETGDPVAASREHVIALSPAGVVTITGGKLTTFRVMAAQTVEAALKHAGRRSSPSPTATAALSWDSGKSVERVIDEATAAASDGALGVHLVRAYGNQWKNALDVIDASPTGRERIDSGSEYRYGELVYAVREEMARTLGDLLIRRTRIAFERRDNGRALAGRVADYVSPLLGWSAEDLDAQIARFDDEIDRIFGVDR